MLSFHNNPEIKAKYLDRVKAHREADELIKGVGWENGKGCAVGCTLHSYDHKRFPIELGLPEWLAKLEDAIFENLPNALAMTWPERILSAIPVGVDVDAVQWRLAIWRHTKQLDRLEENDAPYAVECRKALRLVIDCCKAELEGENPLWSSAESAAWAAALSSAAWARSAAWAAAWSSEEARSAAWAAAWSSAASARSAAWAAAWSSESAAWAAAWSSEEARSAAWSARSAVLAAQSAVWAAETRSAYFVEESEQLLRLFSGCK